MVEHTPSDPEFVDMTAQISPTAALCSSSSKVFIQRHRSVRASVRTLRYHSPAQLRKRENIRDHPLWNMGFITYTKNHSQNTLGLSWAKSKTLCLYNGLSSLSRLMTAWVVSWLGMLTSVSCCDQVQECWSGEPATAPHGAGLVANQEAGGLSCELERSDRIRGHQPSQSTSALLYVHSWQRLNGSDGKRRSPFSPARLPFPPFIPPEGKYRYLSTSSF